MVPPLSSECLWTLLDYSSDVLILLDSEQRVQAFNRKATQLLGYLPDEVVGQPANHLFVTSIACGGIAGVGLRQGGPPRCSRTVLARRRDGVTLPVSVEVRTVHLEGDPRDAWALILRADMMAPLARGAAAPSEASLRAMVDAVTDYGVVMVDAAGTVTCWNQGAVEATGLVAERVVDRPWAHTLPPQDGGAGLAEQILATVRDAGRFQGRISHLGADGSAIPSDVVVTPILDGGRLVGYAEVFRSVAPLAPPARTAATARAPATAAGPQLRAPRAH